MSVIGWARGALGTVTVILLGAAATSPMTDPATNLCQLAGKKAWGAQEWCVTNLAPLLGDWAWLVVAAPPFVLGLTWVIPILRRRKPPEIATIPNFQVRVLPPMMDVVTDDQGIDHGKVQIRGEVSTTSDDELKCEAYVTRVEQIGTRGGAVVQTGDVSPVLLPWFETGVYSETISNEIPKRFDIVQIIDNDPKPYLSRIPQHKALYRTLFAAPGTYELDLLIKCAGARQRMTIAVNWTGRWNELNAWEKGSLPPPTLAPAIPPRVSPALLSSPEADYLILKDAAQQILNETGGGKWLVYMRGLYQNGDPLKMIGQRIIQDGPHRTAAYGKRIPRDVIEPIAEEDIAALYLSYDGSALEEGISKRKIWEPIYVRRSDLDTYKAKAKEEGTYQ